MFLDEIMRQAQESAIIRLSMHIREGKPFSSFPTVSGEVRIIPHKFMFTDEDLTLLQASQVICGTNAERNRINKRVRELQGRGPEPEPDDKIISLDNHWDIISEEDNALTNGAIGNIIAYTRYEQDYNTSNRLLKDFKPTQMMHTDLVTDDGDTFLNLPIDYECLVTGEPSLTLKQEAQLARYIKNLEARMIKNPYLNLNNLYKDIPFHFNYGYAITCWKAQGS